MHSGAKRCLKEKDFKLIQTEMTLSQTAGFCFTTDYLRRSCCWKDLGKPGCWFIFTSSKPNCWLCAVLTHVLVANKNGALKPTQISLKYTAIQRVLRSLNDIHRIIRQTRADLIKYLFVNYPYFVWTSLLCGAVSVPAWWSHCGGTMSGRKRRTT